MINKIVNSIGESFRGILKDGSTIMIGGFGDSGAPFALIQGVLDSGVTNLTIISNNAGNGLNGIASLLDAGRVRKIICSYPRNSGSFVIEELYREGMVELEVIPQGSLVEKIRCGGAGLGGVYTPAGAGTTVSKEKESKIINGREYILEEPLFADIALIKAAKADRWGNCVYSKTARNFGPIMASAARYTIVQVDSVVELGCLSPEQIITPSIFVSRVVSIGEG